MKTKQIALIVLDGWGYREEEKNNAIAEAKTPFFDSLWNDYPHSLLDASEENVGLPKGQIGNSEVGHMTIGAGRVIDTDLVRITKAMDNGEFDTNPSFKKIFDHVKKYDSTLHLMGLVSPGGIHSHDTHLHGILKTAKKAGIKNIAIHAFTDGRDTPPQSAKIFLKELEDLCGEIGLGCIATASGRFYAMDRDNNWKRVEKARQAIFYGKGKLHKGKKAHSVIEDLYKDGILDEHLESLVFLDEKGNSFQFKDNDGVLFFNFRPDRARMLSSLIAETAEKKNICFVTLTEYNKNLKAHVAFAPIPIDDTLASVISENNFSQVHIAETEKYSHATYFLNGGREEPHKGEEHILIESRKDVPTHDLAPEMKAHEIANVAIDKILKGYDFVFINFANADMVGHTANKEAIIKAIEILDYELGRVFAALLARNAVALITADHGNAELNIDQITGERHTAHTLNKVPIIITKKNLTLHDGSLADIAPTILSLYELPIPKVMTGEKLF